MKFSLLIKDNEYTKKNFSPSDFGKPTLELYLALKGVKKTNPPKWNDTLKFGAGNGVESQMLTILKDSGVVDEHYDQEFDGRIEIERNGVKITGYIDAISCKEKGEEPIEIKSINNSNKFDINKYANGYPRENYVGQLSVYMDAKNKDNGNLFVSSIDGLHYFWFDNTKKGDGVYKCGNVSVNLKNEYKRWSYVLEMINKNEMPNIFEYRYKYPLEEIDWKQTSKDKISKARNNQAVIGDWQILYSPYKNLIIEMQKESLGYSQKELEFINKKTTGYTTWK